MSRIRRQRRQMAGQVLMEFTFVAGILLLLVCGVIDLGRAVLARQSLAWVSREAANLAARGTPLNSTVDTVILSGTSLGLRTDGYVILSKVSRDDAGVATITEQLARGGRAASSHVGSAVGAVATMPARHELFPPRGQTVYVAEVSCRFQPVTPLGALLQAALPTELRDVAYF